jgi:phosphopantothenate-cysteine ligase
MTKVLITSGPTSEYIDDVRVITNISTGKLGARIAQRFYNENYNKYANNATPFVYEIYYLHSKNAVKPICSSHLTNFIEANTAQDFYNQMEKLVPKMDICIHCAAISDFTFNRENPVKLKSNDPEAFCDYMKANIKMNPKIISRIKEWNPNVVLVGFKFEVGLTQERLIEVAEKARKSYNGDMVVANDKKMMQDAKEHIAYICSDKGVMFKRGKEDISETIFEETIKLLLKKRKRVFSPETEKQIDKTLKMGEELLKELKKL